MSVKKEKNVSLQCNELNLVWAQMRFCSYWPARIISTPPELGRTPAGKICVLFFGTKQFGFVGSNKIKEYLTHREKYAKIGRGIGFHDAVKRMDDFISNPSKFRSNGFAKPINRRTVAAQSQKFKEKINIVKVELNTPNQQIKAMTSQKEKQTLIDKIVSLKSENQQLALQLRHEQSEKASLKLKLQELAEQINTQSVEMNNLRSKLSEEAAKYIIICARNETKLSSLMRAKDLLEARNKQLQKGIDQEALVKEQTNDKSDDDDVFEVDKLIDHKTKKGVRFYLVRWKGYSEQDDTWEKESNLDCPAILNAYNASIANKND